ncbi:FecR domain-containing protein [uncultured Draconibacterium sp.]|uniref:FecR family protein n=1 Tax=uncultured Draconibacterium sp. TaxID=1573823 RepID=UPI0032180EE1
MEQINNIEQISSETIRLFSGAKVEWSKSKELIWEHNFDELFQETKVKKVNFKQHILKLSIAASFLLLIGIGSFGWFYTESFYSPAGTHLTASLPDGSTVEMNAESSIKFHPYRWAVARNVEFEGEGFFEVQKGKKFTVESQLGETSVLGTSFNVYSRDETYRVLCLTGKVGVEASSKESVILNPNQEVIIKSGKVFKRNDNVIPENTTSWRFNQFLYTAAPFKEVIKEIERQYGISISSNENLNDLISCNFQKGPDVEEILSVVCKPLGYNFTKASEKQYLITRNK